MGSKILDVLVKEGVEPRLANVLADMAHTSIKKGRDYSPGADPYANARGSEAFGVPAWIGIGIRLQDKMQRIRAAARHGKLENEPLEDAFLDTAVYGAIGLVLLREGK